MKNYRKILSVLMALILALSVIAVPMSASAAVSDQAAVGEYIPDKPQGKVDPAYPDFEYTVTNGEAKIVNYNFNGSEVAFPSKLGGYTVTSIGENVFYTCAPRITGVVIPDTVKTIDRMAFYYCNNMTNVVIPDSVTSIGDMAFFGCTSLQDFVFPASLETIGILAFSECALKNAELPDKVKTIGKRAFDGCKAIQKIFIPASVTAIGDKAFTGDKRDSADALSSIIVAPTNKAYDSRNNCNALIETATNTLLVGCNNTIIPDSVTAIGGYAFSGCTGLQRIDIPDGVNSIGDGAFYKCASLQKISLPDGVTVIGELMFNNCTALTAIDFPAELSSIGEKAFSGCTALTSVTFPESLTGISWYAFYGCEALKSVTIPASVGFIGEKAFCGCEALKSVTIPASVDSIGEQAFGYHRVYGKDDIHNEWGWHIKIMDDFTMYGYYGTGAERYATYPASAEEHVRFIGLNEMPTAKKIKADLSDGMLLEVNDLTGTPTTDKYGEPHDYSDDYPNRTVIGIYDIIPWSADHRAVTRPEEPFTVRIRCSQPDAKVYEAGYNDDLNAVYENGWLVFSVDRITRFAVVAGADVVLPVCGDIDGDGELSVYDATIIQRYEAGMTVNSDAEMILHADVNGDGVTDVFDATYVQRYLVSMDTPYPVGEKF